MVSCAAHRCQIYDFICDFLLQIMDISSAVVIYQMRRPFSKYSNESFLLFPWLSFKFVVSFTIIFTPKLILWIFSKSDLDME